MYTPEKSIEAPEFSCRETNCSSDWCLLFPVTLWWKKI